MEGAGGGAQEIGGRVLVACGGYDVEGRIAAAKGIEGMVRVFEGGDGLGHEER